MDDGGGVEEEEVRLERGQLQLAEGIFWFVVLVDLVVVVVVRDGLDLGGCCFGVVSMGFATREYVCMHAHAPIAAAKSDSQANNLQTRIPYRASLIRPMR